MITSASLRDILRTPYRIGGRTVGEAIDCLGVVLEILHRLGIPAPDPWSAIEQAWRTGSLDTASGFPAGWRRLDWSGETQNGDVLLFFGRHPWSAIVVDGHVWSADEHLGGVYCRALSRWAKTPSEVWRYESNTPQGLAR